MLVVSAGYSADWKSAFARALAASSEPAARKLYKNRTDAKRTAEAHSERTKRFVASAAKASLETLYAALLWRSEAVKTSAISNGHVAGQRRVALEIYLDRAKQWARPLAQNHSATARRAATAKACFLSLAHEVCVAHDRTIRVSHASVGHIRVVAGNANHETHGIAYESEDAHSGTAMGVGGSSTAVQRSLRKASQQERMPKQTMAMTTAPNARANTAFTRALPIMRPICSRVCAGASTAPRATAASSRCA